MIHASFTKDMDWNGAATWKSRLHGVLLVYRLTIPQVLETARILLESQNCHLKSIVSCGHSLNKIGMWFSTAQVLNWTVEYMNCLNQVMWDGQQRCEKKNPIRKRLCPRELEANIFLQLDDRIPHLDLLTHHRYGIQTKFQSGHLIFKFKKQNWLQYLLYDLCLLTTNQSDWPYLLMQASPLARIRHLSLDS